jgi:hypothetical protein
MALDTAGLVAALIALLESDPETRQEAAEALAVAIDTFVRTGEAGGDPIT